jgi:hypothetical protein
MSLNEVSLIFLNKYPHVSRDAFEMSMLKLGKKPALKAQNLCKKYYENEKELGYYKFCKEQHIISKDFWLEAIKDIQKNSLPVSDKEPINDNFESLLPVSWIKMNRADRIEFIKKIQHEGFRSYVLNLDPSLKNYFSLIQHKPEKMKLYVTLFQIPASCSEEAKSILRCFVDNLNSFGRANLQFVECKEPNVIEIREMK